MMHPIKRLLVSTICALIVGLPCLPGLAQELAKVQPDNTTGKTVGKEATSKVEGWALVPGGKVWLRPGIDAYEHDTGLVRDLRTGQKSQPITPSTLTDQANSGRLNPPTLPYPAPPYPISPPNPPRSLYQPSPYPPYSPPYVPYAYQPYAMPAPSFLPAYPNQYHQGGLGYDWGPGNVYYNGSGQPCNGCGAKLGSPGSINGRWTRVQ